MKDFLKKYFLIIALVIFTTCLVIVTFIDVGKRLACSELASEYFATQYSGGLLEADEQREILFNICVKQ